MKNFLTIIVIVAYLFTPLHSFSQKKMDVFKVKAMYNRSIGFYEKKNLVSLFNLSKNYKNACHQKLASIYYGLGVPENLVEALKYYCIAAEASEPIPQEKLASYYIKMKSILETVLWLSFGIE